MSIINILQNTRWYICALNLLRNNRLSVLHRQNSTCMSEEIIIPNKIPRSPTDILKALATTIKRDPTAPHYKYHDDPYLIPMSNNAKRIYALSQESGRKAAIWIREKHADLFQHVEADPPIEAFLPKPRFDEFDALDDETLMKIIETASVNDAIELYELMTKNNIGVSDESKFALLELLCFFNENEDLAEELVEEKWYSQTADDKLTQRKTWRDKGYATRLFSELPACSRSYSALIMGMIKYHQIEGAFKLYQEALDKGYILSLGAYNSVLKCANFIKEGWSERWKFTEEILTFMNENGCKPNIQTLNILLNTLSLNPNAADTKDIALKLIAEVGQFGVEPSLGTYHFLLCIFCKQGRSSKRYNLLENILDNIERKEFEIQDPNDTLFFNTAIENCRFHLHDINLAFRLNKFLWHGKNYNFIGNAQRESSYYRHFFMLLFESEVMETIMEQYNYYVPNIYIPEIQVMEALTETVTIHGAVELYPKIWTDIVMFEMFDKNKIIVALLRGMVLNHAPLTSPPSETAIKLADIAYSVFVKNKESTSRVESEWNGDILGNIITLCLCANYIEEAFTIAKILFQKSQVTGVPSIESLDMLLDACIKTKNLRTAMEVLQYAHDNDFPDVKKLAKKLIKETYLSPANSTHIVALFGSNILKEDVDMEVSKNSFDKEKL